MSAAGISAIGPGAPRVPRLPRAARRRRARRGGWRGLALGLSLLLHLAAGWWLLVGFEHRPVREPAEASAMDVLFDGGAPEEGPSPPPEAASAPLDPPSEAALPEPPAPMPRLAEPPAAPPLPAPPAAAPPVTVPPAPVPPSPALAEAPPSPAPPLPRAAPSLPVPIAPAPSDLAPPPAEAPAQRAETAALPLPPPPPEPPPPEPAPQAQAAPSPSPPRPRVTPANPFAGALDLSQGPPISLGRPATPSPSASSSPQRNRDSTSSSAAEADAPNAQLRIRGAQLGADWRSAFMAWLRQHGYYPRQAAEAGEDGTAVVRFSVDRRGQVSGVQLIGRSGSIWLDAGAQALLRGRSVPPFPPGTREDSAEIDLTINYILRRR
ncbi:energy transducer TonB [Roseomonas sp. GCM10028921]